jgi:porin
MLASPWQHYTNLMFTTGSSTMYIPNDATLGFGIAANLTDHIYIIASLVDANSNPTEPFKSFGTFFSKNQYFKSVEVGWISGVERQFFDNFHLTYWHTDASEETASPSGWGLAFSSSWYFNEIWLPFLRGGYSEGANTLIQTSVSTGVGFQPDSGGNLLGAAVGWGKVNEVTYEQGLDNQITLEVFYRLQVSTHFAITPDIQYLIKPALNPDASSIFVWGVRGRLVL